MKYSKTVILLFLLLIINSCKNDLSIDEKNVEIDNSQEFISDNTELGVIYALDQQDRSSGNINWEEVLPRDKARIERVQQMVDSGYVKTARDHQNAAMIFQHGDDSIAYKKAVDHMSMAIQMDSTISKWLYAAATDRYLQSINKPQIYGTQYYKEGDKPWTMEPKDTITISDAERMEYQVETLEEQRKKLEEMNNGYHSMEH